MAVSGRHHLSSSTSMTSDEDVQVYCQPCDEEGPRIAAHGYCTDCKEHLCMTCLTVHKKHKLSKHHKLLDITDMPQSMQMAKPAKPLKSPKTPITKGKPFDFTKPCPKHANEVIKFYCHDHKEFLCIVCVDEFGHLPAVCNVSFISDVCGDIIDSIEYQVILHAINTTAEKYHRIEEDVRRMTGRSNITLKDALEDIKKYRQAINRRLNDLERQIETAVSARQRDNNKTLKTVETTCEDMKKSLRMSSEAMKKFNSGKQAENLFIELKLAEKKIKDAEERTPKLSPNTVKKHYFNRNKSLFGQLLKEKCLGTLTDETLKTEPPTPVQVTTRNVTPQGEIRVKTAKDKSRCRIKGTILLTPDFLIITDTNNKAVKMVDIRTHSVTYQLQLNSKPYDITKVASTELAVTLPDKQLLQFISISSNKLTKKHSLKADGECWGISCHQDKLVVSFWNPSAVKILNMLGNILTSVDTDVLIQPRHVMTNSSSIYVSNSGMKTVTRLNWQGELIGIFGGMEKPKGTALSDVGTVFLCDRGRKVIEEISEDLATGRIVMKNLKHPYSISWCSKTKQLFYSCFAGSKTDNCIYIVHL